MDRLASDERELVALSDRPAVALHLPAPHSKFGKPSLEQVLQRFGPFPEEALFLGQAEDGSSVLLDLHDPDAGPVLVVGMAAAGKTRFLHSIAQYVQLTHPAQEVQFGVITNRVEEWPESLAASSNCIGVFASQGSEAKRFVQSLALWLRLGRTSGQSVLMLVDGFEGLTGWDGPTLRCLQEVLAHGTEKRVWPIVTLHPENRVRLENWLKLFHVHLLACGLVWEPAGMTTEVQNGLSDLTGDGPWFTLREDTGWLRFWVPSLSVS